MKRPLSLLVILLILVISGLDGKQYSRKVFDYINMPFEDSLVCSNEIIEKFNEVFLLIDKQKSKEAVKVAENIINTGSVCPEMFLAYSWSLFRSGDWVKSTEVIDSGITIYGAHPNLIYYRSIMSGEMAELGAKQRNIDGYSMYLGNDTMEFDENDFKLLNYQTALHDIKYLADHYENNESAMFMVGYLYNKLEIYDSSNYYLKKITENDTIDHSISFLIIDNYIAMNLIQKAEVSLLDLEIKFPGDAGIQNRLVAVYEKSGDTRKLNECKRKAAYYSWVPKFIDLPYTDENYKNIEYMISNNPVKKKEKIFKTMTKSNQSTAVDFLICLLYSHSNHDNSIEAKAEELLKKLGSKAVEKTIKLMMNAQSTCTISSAARILTAIKDPRGWNALVDYLPAMEYFPMTTILPCIPEQILKYDEEKGLRVVLEWVRGLLSKMKSGDEESKGIMDSSNNFMLDYEIYSPLAKIDENKVIQAAKELGYSENELELLRARVDKRRKQGF